MRFDILGIFLLLYGIIFLVGASGGSQIYQDGPNVNITGYADKYLVNLSMNNSTYDKTEARFNQSGRMAIINHSLSVCVRDTAHQVYAIGMEFGFGQHWVPPLVFSLGALALMLFYFLNDNFNFLAILIALVIIIKDWASERVLKRGGGHSEKHNKGQEI